MYVNYTMFFTVNIDTHSHSNLDSPLTHCLENSSISLSAFKCPSCNKHMSKKKCCQARRNYCCLCWVCNPLTFMVLVLKSAMYLKDCGVFCFLLPASSLSTSNINSWCFVLRNACDKRVRHIDPSSTSSLFCICHFLWRWKYYMREDLLYFQMTGQ